MWKKLKSLWNNKVLDTTREWEDTTDGIEHKPWAFKESKVALVVQDVGIKQRLAILFTGRGTVRLLNRQVGVIRTMKTPFND